jgi:hypothetical protein
MRQFNELLAEALQAMRGSPASVEVQAQQCKDIARLLAADDQAHMVHVITRMSFSCICGAPSFTRALHVGMIVNMFVGIKRITPMK